MPRLSHRVAGQTRTQPTQEGLRKGGRHYRQRGSVSEGRVGVVQDQTYMYFMFLEPGPCFFTCVYVFRVATAQGKQGIWFLLFPDRENTGNFVLTQGKMC